jgi:hypothetical protein
MEARLQKGMHSQTLINCAHEYVHCAAELGLATRQHVVAELNGTIEELESRCNGLPAGAARVAL